MNKPDDNPHAPADRYVERLRATESAAVELRRLLALHLERIERAETEVRSGRSAHLVLLDALKRGGGDGRRAVQAATLRYEQAARRLRCESVRVLVDEGGLTLTDVGRLSGYSATMARRLYLGAFDDEADDETMTN